MQYWNYCVCAKSTLNAQDRKMLTLTSVAYCVTCCSPLLILVILSTKWVVFSISELTSLYYDKLVKIFSGHCVCVNRKSCVQRIDFVLNNYKKYIHVMWSFLSGLSLCILHSSILGLLYVVQSIMVRSFIFRSIIVQSYALALPASRNIAPLVCISASVIVRAMIYLCFYIVCCVLTVLNPLHVWQC